ncbi:hypothetical protein [Nocardioides kribbensis]|uniref:NYN domain-containing protein n=1 Tax=Nocardioides kribbensis TaxID=305517 RepID=A0ABV1NTE8_9ACTN
MTETAAAEAARVEADLKPGNAAVFIDVENLFKPFRKELDFAKSGWRDTSRNKEAWDKSVRASRRAARQMLPPWAKYEVWHERGHVVARRLVQWFEIAGFTVAENHGRTYGFFDDHGVQTAWQEFVNKHNWNHTLTQRGDDRADRAIISDVRLFAQSELDWFFVGSQDERLVLAESAKALAPYPRKRLAAILFSWSPEIRDAFRSKTHLQGVSARLSFWKMYDAVLRAEKRAASASAGKKRGSKSSAQARAVTERRRAERVQEWADLPEAEVEAAITAFLTGLASDHRGGAAQNMLQVIAKLTDDPTKRRLADAVGRVSETLRTADDTAEAVPA